MAMPRQWKEDMLLAGHFRFSGNNRAVCYCSCMVVAGLPRVTR